MTCQNNHRYNPLFDSLPDDQGGSGRHHCAGCAYDRGFQDGLLRKEQLDLDLDSLPDSQAGNVRHKSSHAAYAMGYMEGVKQSY
jgi:hypothetical protein